MLILKEEVFGPLYLPVFWLWMVAVIAKNTSFDEDLAIVIVNQNGLKFPKLTDNNREIRPDNRANPVTGPGLI